MSALRLPRRLTPYPRSRPSTICLALLFVLSTAVPASASAPLPPAQEPVTAAAPDAPAAFVEHWIGTAQVDGHVEYAYVGLGPEWYEPEIADGSSTTAYDLYVDSAGTITGNLKVRWTASNAIQSEAVSNCLPAVAENSYHGYDCKITLQPTSGSYTLGVTGKRTLEAGIVKFELDAVGEYEPRAWRTITGYQQYPGEPGCCWLWTHTAPSDAEVFLPPGIGMNFEGPPVSTYGHVLVEDDVHIDYVSEQNPHYKKRLDFAISLFEVGADPTLDLNVELLERSVFMDGVSVPDALTVNANWQTVEGGTTDWRLPAGPESTPLSPQKTIQKSVDVGAIGVGAHPVTVKGTDSLKRSTMEEIIMVAVARYFTRCPSFTASKQGNVVTYTCEVKHPEEPFEASIQNVPSFIPYFGGKPLGVQKVQLQATVELKSTGEGSVQGSIESLLDAMGGKIGGRMTIKGDLLLEPTGVRFTGGSLEILLVGKLEKEESLLKVIPPLATPLELLRKVSAPAASWIENRAKMKVELESRIGPTFALKRADEPKGWDFVPTTVQAGGGLKVSLKVNIIEGSLEASAGGGGDVTFTFQVPKPANGSYLQKTELKFLAFITIKALGLYETTAKQEWTFAFPSAVAAADALASGDLMAAAIAAGSGYTSTTGWQRSDRSYLTQPGYSQWTGAFVEFEDVRGTLVQRVNPLAVPAYYNDWLLWSHERPDGGNINADNAREIAFANLGADDTYRVPGGYTLMTNDDRSDFNPQIEFVNGVMPMVVWERMDTNAPGYFPDDPQAYLKHLQVAVSTFDPLSNSPTLAPTQISPSGSLNHRPRITVRAFNPELFLAVWVNNASGKIMGDAAGPDQFMYALYNRNTGAWSAAQTITGTVPGIQSFDMATWRDTTGARTMLGTTLLFTADSDADPETLNDTEIYYTEYRTLQTVPPTYLGWSPITRLTNNLVDERDVQLTFIGQANEGMEMVAIWRADNALMELRGPNNARWSGTPHVIATLPEQAGPLALAAGYDPKLVVAWPQPDGIASVRLLEGATAWTHPRLVKVQATPAAVTVAYASGLTLIARLETGTTITQTVNGHAYGLPAVAQHDLVALPDPTRPVSTTIVADSIRILPGNPVRVAATVENRGDVDAPNMLLAITARVPGSPPTETTLAQQTLAIPNNTRVPVTLTVTTPTPAGAGLELRLAPTGCDYGCTAPSPTVPLPTDAVAWRGGATTYSPHATIATLWVGQLGPLPYTTSLGVLVRKGRGGPVVAQVAAGLSAAPGTLVEVSAPISPTLLGPGTHILEWEIVSDGPVRDLNPSNNIHTSLAVVAADLVIEPLFTALDGTTVKARVQNVGNWPSVATTLEVWSSPPGTTGAVKLGTVAVPPLQPGAHIDLSGAVLAAEAGAAAPQASAAHVLLLDPANLVPEIDENSALTAIAGTSSGPVVPPPPPTGQFKIWLPLVEK